MRLGTLLLVLFCVTAINAQNFSLRKQIGNFNLTTGMSIAPQGYIFLTEKGTDDILKIDTSGELLKSSGGYGWQGSSLDNPADIFTTPTQVLVSDYNNNRVKLFDFDLNLLSDIYTQESGFLEERFGYPTAAVKSAQGDVYILDSENKRVVKFDFFGKYAMSFGSFRDGDYSVNKPKSIATVNSGKILVVDDKRVLVFDSFGAGLQIIEFPEPPRKIENYNDRILLIFPKSIYLGSFIEGELKFQQINLLGLNLKERFIDAGFINDDLFLLSPTGISIFSKTN